MEAIYGSLAVKAFGKDLEITNSRIRIRLFFRDGGYAQEFYAVDGKGRSQLILTSLYKDLIPFSDFRTCSSPMIAGERQHLFGICRESLRMVYSNAEILHHDEQSVEVKLSGSTQGHTLDCRMTLQAESNSVHVTVTDTFSQSGRPPLIEYVMNSFAFVPGGQSIGSTNELNYIWTPTLRPGNDCVIGDHAFHSPALIIQHGSASAALIPDLNMLTQHRAMPAALDLDLENGLLFAPLLSYGFCGYERDHKNKCSRHDITMAKRLKNRQLAYGYHLLLDAKSKRGSTRHSVARFMWDEYGVPALDKVQVNSKASQSLPASQEVADARSAYGLHNLGIENGNKDMVQAARNAKEHILSAPQQNGLFSTRYNADGDEWDGCNAAVEDWYYHTGECSEQLYWLLKWHSDIEQDKRIITYCRKYADFLIESRLRTGAIPSGYASNLHPLTAPGSSIQTAVSVIFLAELAKASGLVKHRSAAERSAAFVLDKLIPGNDFRDHTLIDHERKCTLECSDPHSGSSPQTGRAMLWAAEMCLAMYELTAQHKYLDSGTSVLDQLCLLQSVWNKPWEPEQCFGMVAGDNISADYSPELTLDFARCALNYAALTGTEEYAQRSEAAIRSISKTENYRMQASLAIIQREFGSVYVHIGKKWAVCTDGVSIQDIEYQKGGVRLQVLNRDTASIVFGGMRGNSYKVSINDQQQVLSREQMEAGVSVPASNDHIEDTLQYRPDAPQPRLFD